MPRISTFVNAFRNLPQNLFDPPVVVLLYHRVASKDNDPEQLAVSPENFIAHLAFLKTHFSVLRFEDDWKRAKRPAVVITFDDGYVDNLHEALPLLQHYEIPATFFVSSGTIDDRRGFWWDRLGFLLLDSTVSYPTQWGIFDTSSVAARQKLYRKLQKELKMTSVEHREQIFTNLSLWAGLSGVAGVDDLPLTSAELRSLAASPLVTLGSHTVSHRQLSALSVTEQRQEIADGHSQLEAIVGHSLTIFSYPFGNHEDYNADSVEICRQLGFKKVAANYPAVVHVWNGPLEIPRIIVRNCGVVDLKKQLAIARWLR